MNGMDAVITYVDGSDRLWQQDFCEAAPGTEPAKRYRDWGTLPYLLRGIDRHLPFVENVFLVVSRESQVPAWVDRSRVRVALHADFMPAACLPTFNSTAIELFLHRIPGLAERFLYFNDDFFILREMEASDFFPGGRPAIGFSHHLLATGLYKKQTRNADRLARAALSLPRRPWFLRPQHTVSPMLRSVGEELFSKVEPRLLASVSPIRKPDNINQYVFLDYALLSGRGLSRRLSNRHISLAAISPARLSAAILSPDRDIFCLNDVEMSSERFEALREAMLSAFAARFPQKSRFER